MADEGVGSSDLVFHVRRSLLERKKEKEEEEANRIKEKEMQVKALFSQRSNLAQLCGDDLQHYFSDEFWFDKRDKKSMQIIAQFRVDGDCDVSGTGSSGRSLFCSARRLF